MTASNRGGIFTMAMLLKGAEVAKALTEGLHAKTEELKKNGVEPMPSYHPARRCTRG